MDVAQVIILSLAALSVLALWRLVGAVRNSWDGTIEDLFEDVVIRRLATACVMILVLVTTVLLRGPIRSLLGVAME